MNLAIMVLFVHCIGGINEPSHNDVVCAVLFVLGVYRCADI